MKKWQKILGITVGAVILLFMAFCCLLAFYPQLFMGYPPENEHDVINRNEIVQRINKYIEQHNKHPESLSELGFEQLPGMYKYCDNSIYLIRLSGSDYVLEY